MRLISFLAVVWISVLGCAMAGCEKSAAEKPSAAFSPAPLSNRLFAVSYPLQFLTQKIAGDDFEVLLPFESSDDPRASQPSRATIEQMQNSDLIIANGVGARYAKWLALISLPESKLVNTASYGLALKEYLQIKGESVVHSHGPEGEHSHPVMAARTWLDPALAKKQANYIAKQLSKTYPEQADGFDENLEKLSSQLDELVAQMDRISKLVAEESPVVFGDSDFSFFLRAAGCSGDASEGFPRVSGEKVEAELMARIKARVTKYQSDENRKLVLIGQSSLPTQLREFYQAEDVQLVAIDSLDHPPSSGDYISVMKNNIEGVAEAIRR